MEKATARVRVHGFTLSLDGYAAGPLQDLEHPLGLGADHLHDWLRTTRSFRRSIGWAGGHTGVDDAVAAAGIADVGATIMGRNMFGPVRGEWADDSWRGWWGDEPPFHHPVFVLTHHPRPPLVLNGTTFTFVRDGIEAALTQALAAADGRDVRIGGGAATIRQYVASGLVDDLHLAIAARLLGNGERLFSADLDTSGYECVELTTSSAVAHVHLRRVRSGVVSVPE